MTYHGRKIAAVAIALFSAVANGKLGSGFNDSDLPIDDVLTAIRSCGTQGGSSCGLRPSAPARVAPQRESLSYSPIEVPVATRPTETQRLPPSVQRDDLLDRDKVKQAPPANRVADACGDDPEYQTVRHQVRPRDSWHWQISSVPSTARGGRLVDLDLFEASKSHICALRKSGAHVTCYISATSLEPDNGRPDEAELRAASGGFSVQMQGWPEQYVDIRKKAVVDVMRRRIQLAYQKGCDGVEYDNMDIAENIRAVSDNDAVTFVRALAAETHKYGMKSVCKNSPRIIGKLINDCDMVVVESCYKDGNCNAYEKYPLNNKPVFIAEYKGVSSNNCRDAAENGFTLGFFKKSLGGDHLRCSDDGDRRKFAEKLRSERVASK